MFYLMFTSTFPSVFWYCVLLYRLFQIKTITRKCILLYCYFIIFNVLNFIYYDFKQKLLKLYKQKACNASDIFSVIQEDKCRGEKNKNKVYSDVFFSCIRKAE